MTFLASENEGHLRCPVGQASRKPPCGGIYFLRGFLSPGRAPIPPWYDTDLIPRDDDTATTSDDAGSMPSASPAQKTPTGPLPSAADRSQAGGASFGALAYAAGTLVQIGTRPTPYVRTLDLPTETDLGGRSR